MSRYRYVSPVMNRRVRRPLDRRALCRWSLAGLIGLALALGFSVAAWQQLEALRLNYETNLLRKQLSELNRERERLENERQQKLSPMYLGELARPRDLSLPRSNQIIRAEVRR
ncbi:MAG: hypothetical protein SNJ67_04580 [Chloracidobacterium sp.]|uniref:Cell division protein FtsL n=1 Tax=Chloracidobacterium validum TaxID=2821543 RepID=A0ABX8B818_9BACT|nr:hypothetical protein [Chloracidobacterium validum]QUW03102.1 hypothetical protein J8C06_01260 [Chloracidobacterium validum]